jgi:hypothetical protein
MWRAERKHGEFRALARLGSEPRHQGQAIGTRQPKAVGAPIAMTASG